MPSYKRLDGNGASKFAEDIFAKVKEVVDAIPGGGSGGVDTTASHYLGVTTTAITDGSSTSTVSINGQSHTAAHGDIVSYSGTKFIYDSDAGEWSALGSGGGGGGNANAVDLTWAQYSALTQAQKTNGTMYFITDINSIPSA